MWVHSLPYCQWFRGSNRWSALLQTKDKLALKGGVIRVRWLTLKKTFGPFLYL